MIRDGGTWVESRGPGREGDSHARALTDRNGFGSLPALVAAAALGSSVIPPGWTPPGSTRGPIAQRLERPAHNWLVLGSNPSGPKSHLARPESRTVGVEVGGSTFGGDTIGGSTIGGSTIGGSAFGDRTSDTVDMCDVRRRRGDGESPAVPIAAGERGGRIGHSRSTREEFGRIAQLGEHRHHKPGVAGSIPVPPTIFGPGSNGNGREAKGRPSNGSAPLNAPQKARSAA